MKELFFTIKVLVITVIIVTIMQLPVRGRKVEHHLMGAINSSPLAGELQSAADRTLTHIAPYYHKLRETLQIWTERSSKEVVPALKKQGSRALGLDKLVGRRNSGGGSD